jgi:hypothetical protein
MTMLAGSTSFAGVQPMPDASETKAMIKKNVKGGENTIEKGRWGTESLLVPISHGHV